MNLKQKMKNLPFKMISFILNKDFFHSDTDKKVFLQKETFRFMHMKEKEDYNYYSATSAFMVDVIRKNNLIGSKAISVGGKVEFVMALAPLFSKLYHNSMMPIEDDFLDFLPLYTGGGYYNDFFSLSQTDSEVSVCLSHATIHCMNDTRYNNTTDYEFKSYRFAEKLTSLFPNMKHVILSVPVNINEHIQNNGSHLSNERLITSFEAAGYKLIDTLYDKKCFPGNFFGQGNRFSKSFPKEYCDTHTYVLGNFYYRKV